jgi:hypothetical protein
MPMNVTRYGVAPYAVGGGVNALDAATPNNGGTNTGVNVSGSVQVTGVLLLAVLLVVVVIAQKMGGLG